MFMELRGDVSGVVESLDFLDLHHLAVHPVSDVVVADINVLRALIVDVLLADTDGSCVVNVEVDGACHSGELLEQVVGVQHLLV